MAEEKKTKKPRGVAKLILGKCIACGARCQTSCPKDAIEMNDKGEPIINTAMCVGCRKCLKICPADAIEIYYTPEELKILAELEAQAKAAGAAVAEEPEEEEDAAKARIKDYKGVWIYVEQTEGKAAEVSWGLLGIGGGLAKTLGVELG